MTHCPECRKELDDLAYTMMGNDAIAWECPHCGVILGVESQ